MLVSYLCYFGQRVHEGLLDCEACCSGSEALDSAAVDGGTLEETWRTHGSYYFGEVFEPLDTHVLAEKRFQAHQKC